MTAEATAVSAVPEVSVSNLGEGMSLADWLITDGQPDTLVGFESAEGEQAQAYAITTDDEALWAMRRLAQAQRHIDKVKAQAQAEVDRINRWVEASTTGNVRLIEKFDRLLGDYLMVVREDEADGRKKLEFPDGTVSSRMTPPKVAVEDVEAFLAWAEANGKTEWVRVKREADVATIKKVVDYNGNDVIDPITGVTVAGLSHTEGGVSITVKVTD
jgi:phage host-nuclease inhibitor protein Gam